MEAKPVKTIYVLYLLLVFAIGEMSVSPICVHTHLISLLVVRTAIPINMGCL